MATHDELLLASAPPRGRPRARVIGAGVTLTIIVSLYLVQSVPSGLRAAAMPRETQTPSDAATLLHRAKEALGGADRIDRITSIRVEGTREFEGSRGFAGMANRLNYLVTSPVAFHWRRDSAAIGLDGMLAWSPHLPPTDRQQRERRRRHDFLEIALLFLCRTPPTTSALRVTAAPPHTGLTGHGVEVVADDDVHLMLVLNPNTARPAGVARWEPPLSRTDEAAAVWRVLRVDAYQTRDGIAFPRQLDEQGPDHNGTIWITEIAINAAVSPHDVQPARRP